MTAFCLIFLKMVNTCVYYGCTNTAYSGYRMHKFPDRKKKKSVFLAWVRFVQVRRKDFGASSVTPHSMLCGAHFTHEDYDRSDLMAMRMGYKCKSSTRLIEGAVPSVHPARPNQRAAVVTVKNRFTSAITKRWLFKTLSNVPHARETGDHFSVDPPPHTEDWALECHRDYMVPPHPPPDKSPDNSTAPGNAPSVKLIKHKAIKKKRSRAPIKIRLKQETTTPATADGPSSTTDYWQSEMKPFTEEKDCGPTCDKDKCKAQCCSLEQEVGASMAENRLLKTSKAELNESFFQNNDEKVLMLTGLQTYSILSALFYTVVPHLKLNQALTPFQQFLLTLMKLRLDLSFDFLALFFKVDPTAVSELFKHCINVMYYRLVPSLIVWPDRAMLRKTLPNTFRYSYFEKTACIIDCFEIKIERQQATSDNSHHALKYLIAFSPQGSVSFISNAWEGGASDKSIIENSHFLPLLLPGDLVLADSGLIIGQSVPDLQEDTNIPAFTPGKRQLEPIYLKSTKSLEPFRTHIEKVVGVVRQKYALLESTVPVTFTDKDGENVMCLDKIVKICCALTNVCGSVVSNQ